MSVPPTREPQKIPVSQIARGLSSLVILCLCKATTLQRRISNRHPRIFR